MAISKNYPIVKNHFRKHWQERVKTRFDQPGQKLARRRARAQKAAKVAPRPVDLLRPIVRAPTIRHNRKTRAGRGFTFDELAGASLTPRVARTLGIAVDHRRINRNVEAYEANVARLKEYRAKLIIFSKTTKSAEIRATAHSQSVSRTLPIPQPSALVQTRPITAEAKKVNAHETLSAARKEAKEFGQLEKKAREEAEAEAEKKK